MHHNLQSEHRAMLLQRSHRTCTEHIAPIPRIAPAPRNTPAASASQCTCTEHRNAPSVRAPRTHTAQCSCSERIAPIPHIAPAARASYNAPAPSAKKPTAKCGRLFRLFCNRSASRQPLRPRFTKRAPYAKPFFSSAKTSVIYLYDHFRRSAVFIFPRGLKPADDSIIEPLSPAPT